MTTQRRPAVLLMTLAPLLLALATCDTSGGGTRRVFDEKPISPDTAAETDASRPDAFTGFWGVRRGDRGENLYLSDGIYTMSRYQIAGMALHTQISQGGSYTATADRLTFTIIRTSCPTQTAGNVVYGWEVAGDSLKLTASDGAATTYTKAGALNVNAYDQDLGCFDASGSFTPGDLRSVASQ